MAMNDENSDTVNYATNDLLLYTEAKLTRQQAIEEIGDVILHSDMKPQMVQCTLQLIHKLLPMENTLPTTMEDLFAAMVSVENDERLTQYLIKHNQISSVLPSSIYLQNENTSMPEADEQESDSPICLRCACCGGQNESSSNSEDENELSPYDRLQRCLQPILNLNYTTTLPTQVNNEEEQRFREISRMFAAFQDSSDDENPSDNRRKLSCFEINGHDLLNGGKRRRY